MKKTILITMIIFFAVLCVGTMKSTSPICDEVAHHIANGFSYAKLHDFRMNPSTPALSRSLLGLPLLFLNPRLPVDDVSWQTNDSPVFGNLFLYKYNSDPGKLVFFSRIAVLAQSIVLAILLYLWGKRVYGEKAALFAVFLFVLSPAVIGNSSVAMVDISGALFIFLAVFQFWRYSQNRTRLNLLLSGVCFGLAQSAKHTAIILVPLFIVLDCVYIREKGRELPFFRTLIKDMAVIWSIGFLALWATYFFEFKPLLLNAPDVEEKVQYIHKFFAHIPFLNNESTVDYWINFAKTTPIPLSSFLVSLLGVLHQSRIGQGLVFMGARSLGGIRIYYIVDYLIKTPLPVIVLTLTSLFMVFSRKTTKLNNPTKYTVMLTPLVIFISASLSEVQGGVRYLLPMYPFLFMWVSDLWNIEFSRTWQKVWLAALSSLFAWYLWIAVTIYPNYLAYMNEIVGGIGGYGYEVTHDIDWGQDLPQLAEYMEKEGLGSIKLFYFGTADPAAYDIEYEKFTEKEFVSPEEKVYAISVRPLRQVKWTNEYQPTAKAGYSIFIYDLRQAVRNRYL